MERRRKPEGRRKKTEATTILPHYFNHNTRHQMLLESGCRLLPKVCVSLLLTHGGKEWAGTFNGHLARLAFDKPVWKDFVTDNNLEEEDACVFEIMESSTEIVKLKVILLRGTAHFPPELLEGRNPSTAINIE